MVVLLVKVKPNALTAVKPSTNASDWMVLCGWFILRKQQTEFDDGPKRAALSPAQLHTAQQTIALH
jgi:hypothetical protein